MVEHDISCMANLHMKSYQVPPSSAVKTVLNESLNWKNASHDLDIPCVTCDPKFINGACLSSLSHMHSSHGQFVDQI